MNHAITIGDVLWASLSGIGLIGVGGIIIFLLWLLAQGWNH